MKVNLLLAISESATLLVDTGADCSILKLNVTKDDEIIYPELSAQLRGITNESLSTLGVCYGKIQINGEILEHPFQIVDDNFPVSCDGILGKDF